MNSIENNYSRERSQQRQLQKGTARQAGNGHHMPDWCSYLIVLCQTQWMTAAYNMHQAVDCANVPINKLLYSLVLRQRRKTRHTSDIQKPIYRHTYWQWLSTELAVNISWCYNRLKVKVNFQLGVNKGIVELWKDKYTHVLDRQQVPPCAARVTVLGCVSVCLFVQSSFLALQWNLRRKDSMRTALLSPLGRLSSFGDSHFYVNIACMRHCCSSNPQTI